MKKKARIKVLKNISKIILNYDIFCGQHNQNFKFGIELKQKTYILEELLQHLDTQKSICNYFMFTEKQPLYFHLFLLLVLCLIMQNCFLKN